MTDFADLDVIVDVLAVEGRVFIGTARLVTLPGGAGEFGVMAGHMHTTAALAAGEVRLDRRDGTQIAFPIAGGAARIYCVGTATVCEVLADMPRPA